MLELPQSFKDRLKEKAYCHIATLMPDGSPHMTVTWVDTDDTHVIINTVEGHQKLLNMRRDPRVALNIPNPENPGDVVMCRGVVVEITAEGAREHIDKLSMKYSGRPYANSYGAADQVRIIVKIGIEKFLGWGGRR